jgi:hypothetical protein
MNETPGILAQYILVAWAIGIPGILLRTQANHMTSTPVLISATVALTLLAAGAVVAAVHGASYCGWYYGLARICPNGIRPNDSTA